MVLPLACLAGPQRIFVALLVSDLSNQVVHYDDLDEHLEHVEDLDDRVQEALLVCDQLPVEEKDQCLHGGNVVILEVVLLPDGSQELDTSRLLVVVADVLQQPVEPHGLHIDRREAIVTLMPLVEFRILILSQADGVFLEAL